MAKEKHTYNIYKRAAELIGMNHGNFSRAVRTGKISGGKRQVYIQDDEGNFHKVGKTTIKVVRMETLEKLKK